MINFRVYAYLRASTKKQDANRAKDALEKFAKESNLKISTFFVENESGATLNRPELFRLLDIAQTDDILLVEQIDRISRLNDKDWNQLKAIIKSKGIRVVSLDLPMSYQLANHSDEFTGRMLAAINDLMLDMLAAVARKDYQDRRRRQKEGIEKAKAEGRYKGRGENKDLLENVEMLLKDKKSYSTIIRILGCSRATVAKVAKGLKSEDLS